MLTPTPQICGVTLQFISSVPVRSPLAIYYAASLLNLIPFNDDLHTDLSTSGLDENLIIDITSGHNLSHRTAEV